MACALRLVVLLVLVAALCCLPDFTRVVWAASKLYLSHWAPVFGDAMMLVIGTMFFAVNDWDTPAARLPRILFGCGRRGQQAMWLAAGVVLCGGWTAKQLRRGVAPPLMAVFVAIKLVGWPAFQAVDLFLLWASYVRCPSCTRADAVSHEGCRGRRCASTPSPDACRTPGGAVVCAHELAPHGAHVFLSTSRPRVTPLWRVSGQTVPPMFAPWQGRAVGVGMRRRTGCTSVLGPVAPVGTRAARGAGGLSSA